MGENFGQRFLALHYVYPKPLNKIMLFMKGDPELENLSRRPLHELAEMLQIKPETAAQIRSSYTQALTIPFNDVYEKHKIIPISYTHPSYPESLLQLIDPPAVLYAKGDPGLLLNENRIAVVGARKASPYSQTALNSILPALISSQYTIVSGLAIGADAMAHRTALDMGGRTIAVTGSGFLHPYPKENAELNSIIEEKHLVVTEYPPYMTPKRWNFPMRNRIISGLSKGVIVTEARTKSGTWSTVEHALDHGKDIFAVPGHIASLLSEGPHKLIAEGAKPVWNGLHVLEEYEQMEAENKGTKQKTLQ